MNLKIGSQVDTSSGQSKKNKVLTAPSKVHKAVSWAGTCTSALCAVHCFGTAVIAVLSPGLLKLLPHSEMAEMIVLGISITTAFLSLRRVHAFASDWVLFVLFSSLGVGGIMLHKHLFLGVALATLAILQLWIIWKRHHPLKAEDVPDCCQHEHSHNGQH